MKRTHDHNREPSMANPVYKVLPGNSIWEFDYAGSEPRPIRRVVALTEETDTLIRGYELYREGKWNKPQDSTMKSYRKDRIDIVVDRRHSIHQLHKREFTL